MRAIGKEIVRVRERVEKKRRVRKERKRVDEIEHGGLNRRRSGWRRLIERNNHDLGEGDERPREKKKIKRRRVEDTIQRRGEERNGKVKNVSFHCFAIRGQQITSINS